MRVNRSLDEYLQMRKMQRENLIKVLPFLTFANEFFLHSDLVKGKELREYFKHYSDNIEYVMSSIRSVLEYHIELGEIMKRKRERRRLEKEKRGELAEICRLSSKDKTKQEVEEVEDIDIAF